MPSTKEATSDKKLNRSPAGIGRTLTYAAIFAGVLALLGPRLLKEVGVNKDDSENASIAEWSAFNWSGFDWTEFYNSLPTATTDSQARPGAQLALIGAKAKYPILIIPGFTTSGLEVWGNEKCGRKYFRTRFWGTMDQAKALIEDMDCWRRHMMLDPFTGTDPSPEIKLRPTEGFTAGDYFMAPYWVWGKMIENFADVGYDPSNMAMMSYDWRLAFQLCEERDGFFTKVKNTAEAFHERSGEKVVLMAHSMGGTVVHYFFKWVTTPKEEGGGGGGEDWVEKHVHSYLNIAGALLGVPKAVSALLSGEMKDTSNLLGTIGDIAEQLFGRKLRKDMFATWGALWAMLPKGGDIVWNTVPDGAKDIPMLVLTDPNTDIVDEEMKNISEDGTVRKALMDFGSKENHTASDVVDMLLAWGAGYGPSVSGAKFNLFKKGEKLIRENWHDVTVTPLPVAPSTKIYCMYGVGAETEVGYYYKTSWGGRKGGHRCSDDKCDPPFLLDSSVNDIGSNATYGVRFGNGDGTVPLVSLGHPCIGGWATQELNPGQTKVITREYVDKSTYQVNDPLRGGPESGLHVDILGNLKLTEDIVRIATGYESEKVYQHVVSDIELLSKMINEKLS